MPLRELARTNGQPFGEANRGAYLFAPEPAFRVRNNVNTDTPLPPEQPAGQNPPDGAILDYALSAAARRVVLTVYDEDGHVERRYASDDSAPAPIPNLDKPAYWERSFRRPETAAGMHRFVWDLREAAPQSVVQDLPIAASSGRRPTAPRTASRADSTEITSGILPGRPRREYNTHSAMDPRFQYRGSLSETPLAKMLATIHRYRVPGVLTATRAGTIKRVFLEDGRVVFATSSEMEDTLGAFLVSRGVITSGQVAQTSARIAETGKRQGEVLIDMGILSRAQMAGAVLAQVASILWSLFRWEDGEVTFEVGRFRAEETIQMDFSLSQVIREGLLKHTDARSLVHRIGPSWTVLRSLPTPPLPRSSCSPPKSDTWPKWTARPRSSISAAMDRGMLRTTRGFSFCSSHWI